MATKQVKLQSPELRVDGQELDRLGEEQLLDLYLSLTGDTRRARFADTARAAEITGMARRTVQMWAELGAVQAVQVGGKYQIDLDSLRSYLKNRATSWLDK